MTEIKKLERNNRFNPYGDNGLFNGIPAKLDHNLQDCVAKLNEKLSECIDIINHLQTENASLKNKLSLISTDISILSQNLQTAEQIEAFKKYKTNTDFLKWLENKNV